jgi:hypothetical protein
VQVLPRIFRSRAPSKALVDHYAYSIRNFEVVEEDVLQAVEEALAKPVWKTQEKEQYSMQKSGVAYSFAGRKLM